MIWRFRISGFRISGFGFRFLDFGFGVLVVGSQFWVLGVGVSNLWCCGVGFWDMRIRFRVLGLEFYLGLEFMVLGFEIWVWVWISGSGLGFGLEF